MLPVRCPPDDRIETPEGCYAEVTESHPCLTIFRANGRGCWAITKLKCTRKANCWRPWPVPVIRCWLFANISRVARWWDQRHVGALAAGRVCQMARLSPAVD